MGLFTFKNRKEKKAAKVEKKKATEKELEVFQEKINEHLSKIKSRKDWIDWVQNNFTKKGLLILKIIGFCLLTFFLYSVGRNFFITINNLEENKAIEKLQELDDSKKSDYYKDSLLWEKIYTPQKRFINDDTTISENDSSKQILLETCDC